MPFALPGPLPWGGGGSGHHLVEDPALLEHVEPVGQRRVELAALVLHGVHHHRAPGAPVQQQVGCLEAVLEVPVIPDDHVVLKSPAIYKRKANQWTPQA